MPVNNIEGDFGVQGSLDLAGNCSRRFMAPHTCHGSLYGQQVATAWGSELLTGRYWATNLDFEDTTGAPPAGLPFKI